MGTLIGVIVGMLGHIAYNMPRTRKEVDFRVAAFVFSGIGIPTLTAVPLIALFIYTWQTSPPTPQVFAVTCGLTLVLVAIVLSGTEGLKRT